MKRYEKYKDSGVEWIGEIPDGWEVKILKRFAKICNGQDPKSVWDLNGCFPIIGSGGIFGKSNKFLYDQPSVILGRKGTIDKPQYVDKPFWTVDTAYYTDIFSKTDKRFFYYLCLTIKFDLYKYGSAVPSMNQETLSQIPFTSPPKPEQTAIANYLDRKTAEIDALIFQKERLIELYEEEKTAIINQAVTKGIDPDTKLKESGVDWLGDVPDEWKVKKLKYVAYLGSGDNLTSNQIKENSDYPVYGGNGLRGYFDDFTHEGDLILIGRQGALCGNINYAKGKFWATDHAVVVKPWFKYRYIWLGELLRTMNLNQYSVAAAQPGLSVETIKNLLIPFPTIDEQTAIVNYIETELTRINTKIAKTQKIIALQKEYRAALISEVVTGKIKVTQEVAL